MPSVTPVCYGSIFSGAAPSVHGIQKYEKPVLQVETLFDVFPKAGKRVAIVCCNNCSIDMIFRKRQVDYYSFHSNREGELTGADQKAIEQTLELGWELLRILPRSELKRISDAMLDKYYDPSEAENED